MGHGASLNVCRSISRTRSTPTMARLTGYRAHAAGGGRQCSVTQQGTELASPWWSICDLQTMPKPTGQTASNGCEDQSIVHGGVGSVTEPKVGGWRCARLGGRKVPREKRYPCPNAGISLIEPAGRHGAQRLSWFRSPPASDCACTYLLRHEATTLHRLRRHSATRAWLAQPNIDIDR